MLFSNSLTFLLKTGVVTKPGLSGVFYKDLQFFFLNFISLCFIDFRLY